VPKKYSILLEEVSRGGLAHPTEFSFAACCPIFLLLKQILDDDSLLTDYMKKSNQRKLFVSAVTEKCNNIFTELVSKKCKREHSLFDLIAIKLFNTFQKNTLKRYNDKNEKEEIEENVSKRSRTESARKIHKLQSKCK